MGCTFGFPVDRVPDVCALPGQTAEHCLRLEGAPARTLFAFPGLMFIVDFGGGRAEDAAAVLAGGNVGAVVSRIDDREAKGMQAAVLADPGARFFGLHYSMGAHPKTVSAALAAVRAAGAARKERLVYNVLLVEPFALERMEETLDLNDPHLGFLTAVISEEFSFLRPDAKQYPPSLLRHPKVLLVFAEEMGLGFGHFGFLGAVRGDASADPKTAERSLLLFNLIGRAAATGLCAQDLGREIVKLRLRFAEEDGRTLHVLDPSP